jgi:hypothetical protein
MKRLAAVSLALVALAASASAAQHFITTTFGNDKRAEHPGTLTVKGDAVRLDLSSLPPATRCVRAVLRVPTKGHRHGTRVTLVPVGLENAAPLPLRPPYYVSFDALAAVQAWVANPDANQGLRIVQRGGLDFRQATLEVSYYGESANPIPPISGLRAIHQAGQTFLVWRELEDVVRDDAPPFVEFERRVLAARDSRRLTYRVYRHDRPITVANLAEADLVLEVPEAVPAWNLKAIRNTEHPNQGTPTKHSPLRPGYNLALNHVMTRYRITREGEPLPRASGLAVWTVTRPGKRYYAVVATTHGREAIASLGAGASLESPVDEKPARFPAIVYQRTVSPAAKQRAPEVRVYNSWLGPPYVNVPSPAETFVARWSDLPQADDAHRLPLLMTTGTHGCSATELGNPGWHAARRHVAGALIIGVTEGGLWQGVHECIGTLRGYDDGVVHNYPQRRVLAAAAWAKWNPSLFVDPERVFLWGQMAAWALRHGDVFSAVMSNGYGNLAIGKEAQKHGWKWGPYPRGSRNWLGVDQWEYMDVAKWVRENPTVELPYWLCWPAYGAYPSHTIGDFGFMPWPEMIHAMASTKRAFAANWSTNGPGPVGPLRQIVPRIRLHQSLPAFGRCSLDHSPGDGDHADAQKGGGINVYQAWEPESIVDEAGRWGITVHLRDDCPASTCTTDLTPRRCQKFKAKEDEEFRWAATSPDGRTLQSGTATADAWGLVTIQGLALSKAKVRVAITR